MAEFTKENPLTLGTPRSLLPRPCVLVIFGAAGDLSWRKLLPAIYNLNADGLLPSNFAVVGFGNLTMAAEMRPTITTVDIDGARIGREAVNLLRRRAAGEKIEQRLIDVGFRLVVRESA